MLFVVVTIILVGVNGLGLNYKKYEKIERKVENKKIK
jgi:hypothetical protein